MCESFLIHLRLISFQTTMSSKWLHELNMIFPVTVSRETYFWNDWLWWPGWFIMRKFFTMKVWGTFSLSSRKTFTSWTCWFWQEDTELITTLNFLWENWDGTLTSITNRVHTVELVRTNIYFRASSAHVQISTVKIHIYLSGLTRTTNVTISISSFDHYWHCSRHGLQTSHDSSLWIDWF